MKDASVHVTLKEYKMLKTMQPMNKFLGENQSSVENMDQKDDAKRRVGQKATDLSFAKKMQDAEDSEINDTVLDEKRR